MSVPGRFRKLWRRDVGADVGEELKHHWEQLVEEGRAAGLDEAAAERAASERFGSYEKFERECREIDEESARMRERKERVGSVMQDLRYGLRQLRSNPLATGVAVVTLALGIGANTAMFSVVNGVLLRPLPYADAERLVTGGMSFPDFRDVRERVPAFDATTVWASNMYTVRDGDEPEEILGATVEPAFFEMLAPPVLGRAFTAAESQEQVAVISDALWRRRYGARSDVTGRTIDLSGKTYTITGVMAPGFDYPSAEFHVWVPLDGAMSATPAQLENRMLRIFRFVAHLAPGVTLEAANAELAAVSSDLERLYPESNDGVTFEVISLYDVVAGYMRGPLAILLGVVGMVLLIACVNVANVMLGVTAARGREIAVRRALGASRGRLIRQLLTESVLLGLLGGCAGLAVAFAVVNVLPNFAVGLPRVTSIALDGRVLAFGFAVSFLTAVLFGLAPALQGSRGALSDVLRDGARGAVGVRGGSLRNLLVAAEIALCAIVLVGAGLLLQSLVRVLNQDIGFEAENLISANTGLFYFDDPAERAVRLEQALGHIAALPSVQGVAAGTGLPPQTPQRGTGYEIAGREADDVQRDGAFWMAATPGYFNVLGTAIVAGREFNASDAARGAPVAIINQGLATALFGEQSALGRQVRLTNPDQEPAWRTIVGVVEDVRYRGVENESVSAIYTPFAQTPFLWAYVVVRSDRGAPLLTRPLREAFGRVDARMVPGSVRQHTDVVSDLIAPRRFLTLLLAAFAGLALVLAGVGIYGVIAYSVVQRRREIGVRIALGARTGTVVGQVVRRALILSVAGIAVGTLASLWLTRLLTTMLYQIRALDPATFVAGALVIAAVALAASALPAWRAAHLDPLMTLRE